MRSPEQVADMIGKHMAMCREMKEGNLVGKHLVHPFELDEYRAAVQGLLSVEDVDKLLEPRIVDHYLSLIEQLNTEQQHEFFKPRHKCCATVVPASNYGHSLDEKQQTDGRYLRFMIVDGNDETLDNYGPEKSFLYLMQPEEIQADLADGGCTFYILPTDEPVHIVQKARQAIENLKGWLR